MRRAAQLPTVSSSIPIERGEVLALVADDDRLGDVRRDLELVLDLRRRDVLAAGGDDDVLHAIGDGEEAVVVEHADVAGVQPAVGIEGGGGGGRVVEVAEERARAPGQDLAVVADADLAARERPARPCRCGRRRSG